MLETTMEMHRGRRLRVAQLGNGPPLILLHGYPDTLQVWSRLAPLLSAAHRVIAFDWPGMGQSEAWPGGATPYDMAERLRTLLNDWQLDKAIVLGMDMGGQPALAFAANHRQRVQSLIVMNSLVQWDEKTSWEINLLRRFGWNRFALRYLPGMVFGRALRTFLAPGEGLDPPLRSDMWQSFRNSQVRDFIIRMCAGYQGTLPHLAQMYPSIDTPTLVLWAEHDKHFPTAHGKRLQATLPNAILQIVPGAEHWMAFSMAEEVSGRVIDFLNHQLE